VEFPRNVQNRSELFAKPLKEGFPMPPPPTGRVPAAQAFPQSRQVFGGFLEQTLSLSVGLLDRENISNQPYFMMAAVRGESS
jgi:hypothetical protein